MLELLERDTIAGREVRGIRFALNRWYERNKGHSQNGQALFRLGFVVKSFLTRPAG